MTHTTSTTNTQGNVSNSQLPDVDVFQTEVSGVLGGSTVFDQSVAASPGSAAVVALEQQVTSALQAGGAGPVSGPTLVSSGQTSHTVLDHTEVRNCTQIITTTDTFGPATILIGDDQSQSFFVAAGTENINTNTDTRCDVVFFLQTTVTHTAHEQLSATVVGRPPLTVPGVLTAGEQATVAGAPAQVAAAPSPVTAAPRTTG